MSNCTGSNHSTTGDKHHCLESLTVLPGFGEPEVFGINHSPTVHQEAHCSFSVFSRIEKPAMPSSNNDTSTDKNHRLFSVLTGLEESGVPTTDHNTTPHKTNGPCSMLTGIRQPPLPCSSTNNCDPFGNHHGSVVFPGFRKPPVSG